MEPNQCEGLEHEWAVTRNHPAPLDPAVMAWIDRPLDETSLRPEQIQGLIARDLVRACSPTTMLNVALVGDSSLQFKNSKQNAPQWRHLRGRATGTQIGCCY